MQLTLKDGTILTDVIVCNGSMRHVQGASRDTLEFQFPVKGKTLSELDRLFSEDNTDQLTILDGSSETVHSHYCIRAELSKKPVATSRETAETPETTQQRHCVIVAQLTYAELRQQRNAQDIADINEAVAVLAFGGDS